MKSRRSRKEPIESREVISVASTKCHYLVTNNKHVTSKESDVKPEHISFIAANPPNDGDGIKHIGGNKI